MKGEKKHRCKAATMSTGTEAQARHKAFAMCPAAA